LSASLAARLFGEQEIVNLTLETTNSLGQRALTGGIWLIVSRIAQKGIYLIQIAILARFLDPKAFGLIDLANLSTLWVSVFVYTGFDLAVIQKPDLKEEDVHTAWWGILGRHIVIGIVLALLANPIGNLYRSPESIMVLIAFALLQPIHGLISPSPVLFQKSMQFRRLFYLEAGSSLSGFIIGLTVATIIPNVWALVIALFSTYVTYLLLSYYLHPYRPKWLFDWSCFRHFLSYGGWILAGNILWFFCSQGSSAFCGWMFGITSLGLYQMAARFAMFPSIQLNEVIHSALMPAYSMIQVDKDRVSKAFLRSISLASMLIMGLTALLSLGLPTLLTMILGVQWLEAVSLVPAIVIAGGTQALLRTGSSLYLGTGYPRSQFFIDLVQASAMASLLFPFARLFGLFGLPYAMIGGAICSIPVWWLGIRRCTNCSMKYVFTVFIPPGLGVVTIIILFFIGQTAGISKTDSFLNILWHLTLIGITALGYLKTIDVSQRIIPNYSPLADLKRLFREKWQHGNITTI